MELDRTHGSKGVANVLAALLCVFQILEVGAGQSFNLDEKEFIDNLYTVILCLYQQPFDYSRSDFMAFLKCVHLVFVQKKQF